MDDDQIREQVMAQLAETFGRVFYERPDGAEYARRYTTGAVSFVVTLEGISIHDRTLGVPGDN